MNDPRPRDLLARNAESARELFAMLPAFAEPLARAADATLEALLAGRKVLACGNGGSAADAAHFTAEIAGRYVLDRPGFTAIDLTSQHSLMTALINDFPPEQVYARQVQALGAPGDVLVAFTTSGKSTNVRLALEVAGAKSIKTIAFLGRDGGACRGLADVEIIVPSDTTARIQEAHLLLYHTLCEIIDPVLAEK